MAEKCSRQFRAAKYAESEKTGLNFTLLATPAEGLSGRDPVPADRAPEGQKPNRRELWALVSTPEQMEAAAASDCSCIVIDGDFLPPARLCAGGCGERKQGDELFPAEGAGQDPSGRDFFWISRRSGISMISSVRAKLSNENFVAHAPAAVIENERKKEADSLSKIESLESKLKALKK